MLVTITGLNHYYKTKPFKINGILKLKKEYDNVYDDEAIKVELPFVGVVGYVANSSYTVYSGTMSAGRIYDKIDDYTYAKILVITHSSVIAEVMNKYEVENVSGNIFENAETEYMF